MNKYRLLLNKNMDLVFKIKFMFEKINTTIDLYKSNDGIKFDFCKNIILSYENNNLFNQNPFFFQDPIGKKFFLIYYSGNGYNNFEIRVRYGKNIEELDIADDVSIIHSKNLMAAPGIFYDKNTKNYWILVECIDKNSKWIVRSFHSKKILSNYKEAINSPILIDDIACPFPIVNNNNLHLFVSKRIRPHKWDEIVYAADLSKSNGKI